MKIISVMNIKGGVGKSLTAELHHSLQNCIWHTSVENLDVLPSSLELFVVVYELNGKGGSDFMLYKGLHELTGYDVVIIDNNPSVNKMTFNSIYAADMIICPTNIGRKTLTGVTNTRKICLQAMDQPGEKEQGYCVEKTGVLTMRKVTEEPYEIELDYAEEGYLTMMGRTRTSREGAEQLRTIYKDSVMKTEIRYQVKPVQECELDGKSLVDFLRLFFHRVDKLSQLQLYYYLYRTFYIQF